MGKADESNWEDNKRNQVCTEKQYFRNVYYLGTLFHEKYKSLSQMDKQETLKTHRHLSKCKICKIGFIYFKEVLAINPKYGKEYSPRNFRLLKENEKILDNLVK